MGETWGGWTDKFLAAIGAPGTVENKAAIYSIIKKEGTSFTWNPLAISGTGGTGSNSSGVGNFATEAEGITATVRFLSTPGANDYPGRILNPLRGGSGRLALAGFDASGAWSGDFPEAYTYYGQFLVAALGGSLDAYSNSPLLADPGHGAGDIGAVTDETGIIPDISDPIDQLIDIFKSIANFFAILIQGSTWVRIGEILGGALLIGLALALLNKDIYGTDGKSIVKTVAKVAAV